jgi:hypothetical protein
MSFAKKIRGAVAGGARRKRAGSKGRRALLFGDSHAYAYQRAIEKRLSKGRPAPLKVHRLLKTKDARKIGDTSFEKILTAVRGLGPDDLVFSVIGGNQHAAYSMVQHPDRFDFFQPGGKVPRGADTAIVPYRALERAFERGLREGDGKSLQALKQATAARVVHIIPPPPKKDSNFIQRFHESHFATLGIQDLGVSHPGLRLKFWLLQKRELEKLCANLGIEVLVPPPAALDEKGFLATEFYAGDGTHANYQYAELVLREIESRYLGKDVVETAA